MNTEPVVELARCEHARIGDIIADGFADDPVNLWTFRSAALLRPVYTAMARGLYLPRGFGHRCGDVAGTLWLPPGVKKDYGLRATLTIAAHLLGRGGPGAARRGLLIDRLMLERKPKEPHYYLFAIAARPSHQGQGLGGRLMREALTRIDADGMPAYLENSKPGNIGFYQRHGFELLDEVRASAEAPPLFLMWRPAR